MRPQLRAAAVGVAIATVIAASVTADAASPTPFMAGSNFQGGQATISAHGSGGRATGTLVALGVFRADVTCLFVNGNDGMATATITSSVNPGYPVGETIVAEAVDNGGAPEDLWRISFADNGGTIQLDSRCSLAFLPPLPIQRGHVVVG